MNKKLKCLVSKLLIAAYLVTAINTGFAAEPTGNGKSDFHSQESVGTSVYSSVYTLPPSTTTPTNTPAMPSEILLPSSATITDTVMNPDKPVMYAVDQANSKVYAVNYRTSQVSEVKLSLPPESIAFSDNELYVTLLKGQHSSYWWDEEQQGAIAIIDTEKMVLKDQFDIDIDPAEIIADGKGYLYVVSGSGQWTSIKSYSRLSRQQISSATIRQMSSAGLNHSLNRIYAIDTDGTPCMSKYDISEGILTTNIFTESINYPSLKKFRISPDGKYLFNTSGVVMTCDTNSQNERFRTQLSKRYSDVAFDLDNNRFYTAVENKLVYVYDYQTFIGIDTFKSKGNIKDMYFQNNNLVALSFTENNIPMIEQINTNGYPTSEPTCTNTALPAISPTAASTPSPTGVLATAATATPMATPTPTITSTPAITPTQTIWNEPVSLGIDVTKTVINTEKDEIYSIDSENNRITKVNYRTGQMTKQDTFYTPTAIYYSDGLLLVGFGYQGYVGTYDPDTLVMKSQIFTGYHFTDMALGNDGYLYTGPGIDYTSSSIRSFSLVSKQEVSYIGVGSYDRAELAVNPVQNTMYIGSGIFNYDQGQISSTDSSNYIDYHESPRNKVSPDGNYVFNASGTIYTKDFKFYFKLNHGFTDAAFDIGNNRFYTAVGGKEIKIYDNQTFESVGVLSSKGTIKDLYCDEGRLIAVSKADTGEYIVEKIGLPSQSTPTPTAPPPVFWDTITDSVINEAKSALYFVDSENKALICRNYKTKISRILRFYYSPMSIDIAGDTIVVGFGNQGMIGIYDMDSLAMKDKVMTGMTFSDFGVGKDGYIYVISSKYIKSLSLITKKEIYSGSWNSERSADKLVMHPARTCFYISSPYSNRMIQYGYHNGELNLVYNEFSSSEGVNTGSLNRISPDGRLIFNETGRILMSSQATKYDLKYIGSLREDGFSSICFNLEKDRIYAASKDAPVVSIYKYSTFEPCGMIVLKNMPQLLHVEDGNLIAFTSRGTEKVAESAAQLYTPLPVPTPGIMQPPNAEITDVVSHPARPYIYTLDAVMGRLILHNTETGEKKEIRVEGNPENLCYFDDEIYVGVGELGKIFIYSADTLEYKDYIPATSSFKDFIIGNDGYIYTSPTFNNAGESYIKSYSRISKKEESSLSSPVGGCNIVVNPMLNLFYIANFSFRYGNGEIYLHASMNIDSYSGLNIVSTDGKYLISKEGRVYSTSSEMGKDSKYLCSLGTTVKDIAFDLPKNRFYVVNGTNTITVYNYRTFQKLTTLELKGEGERIFHHGTELVTLSKNKNNAYYLENVDIQQDPRPNDVIMPETLLIRQLSKDSLVLKWSNDSPYTCMVEYGINSDFSNKTNWEEIPANHHSIVINGLYTNVQYTFKIRYKAGSSEMTSDEFWFSTSSCAYIDVKSYIHKMVMDNSKNIAYAYSKNNNMLFAIDLAEYELKKTNRLGQTPADMCLSDDAGKLFVLDKYGAISVYDTASLEKTDEILLNLPNISDSNTHFHIYCKNNRLFIVDGAWAPGLWVYDLSTGQVKKTNISGIGDLVFSSSGNEFYYWYQYGWHAGWVGSNIVKCSVDSMGNIKEEKKLYVVNTGYNDMNRDPLDTPIFLDEERNMLYCKNIVLDTVDFKIKQHLMGNVYALSPDKSMMVVSGIIFRTSDYTQRGTIRIPIASLVMFNPSGDLYMCQNNDTRISFYNPDVYKVSGIIKPDFSFENNSVKSGFKIEVLGTECVAFTDNTGSFVVSEVPSNVGGYTLRISKDNYLTREIRIGNFNKDTQIGSEDQPVYMWAGDIMRERAQDGAINMADIMEMAKGFNSLPGDPRYDIRCDVNLDGAINMMDIMIAAKHFNSTSANYPAVQY